MHVAIIGSRGYPYVYSGYETFVRELSERLVGQEVNVTVYCHKGLFSERPSELSGIRLRYLPALETKVLSQLSHSLLAFTDAIFRQFDVILVVNSANGPFGILTKLFRKKTVINVDGLEWLRPKWRGIGARYFYFASWLSTRVFDRIVNDSDEMRNIYLDLFGKESTVIAYGAKPRHSTEPARIAKWDLKENGYYLIVGRMVPDNNSDLIVKGFMESDSRRKLVIVGDVPYKDHFASNIKSMADKDDRLLFTGYVTDPDDLAELYHNAYGYIHGHEFGGTNPTMLKAMAYGSCILALDTRFNREMLQNGKYGLFFQKEAKALTDLIQVIDNDYDKMNGMKTSSREGITKKYHWDHVTSKYLDLFRDLVG